MLKANIKKYYKNHLLLILIYFSIIKTVYCHFIEDNKEINKRSLSLKYSSDKIVESDDELSNPYRGFFHGAVTIDLTDYPELDCNYIDKFYSVKNYKNGLQYLGVRLAEYRDRDISSTALTALDNLLNEYKKRKENIDPTTQVILRFYYNGDENCKTDSNYNVKLVKKEETNSIKDDENESDSIFKQLDNGHLYLTLDKFNYIKNTYNPDILNNNDKEKKDAGTEKNKAEEIQFYNDENELKKIYINDANEIEKGEEVLTNEEEEKFQNSEKYLNERYLNDNNKLRFTDNELRDYTDNLIFCNSNFNKKSFSLGNKKDSIESKFGQKNATESDFSKFKIPVARVIDRKRYYNVCQQWSSSGECEKKKSINKYCIYKYDAESDGLKCEKYTSEEIEPKSVNTIVKHVKQLAPIVNKYKDIVYIYQGTFIGRWGEMNGSPYTEDLDGLTKIINTIEENFDQSIFLGVRTPRYRRGIINKSKDRSNYKTLKKRLGLYNDGLFYNINDLGTYGYSSIKENDGYVLATRAEEVEYQNDLCLTVPNGGEAIYNSLSDSYKNVSKDKISSIIKNPKNYNNFYVCDDHCRNIHLSFLNDDYDKDIFNHWKKTSYKYIYDDNWKVNGFEYIGNHLGYRYVLRGTSFDNSSNVLTVSVENVGYSPAYIKFKTYIILVSSDKKKVEIKVDTDNRKWYTKEVQKLTVNFNSVSSKLISNKTYTVYFKMVDANSNNDIRIGITNNYYYSCYKNNYYCGYKIGTLTVN
ncbi:hypothetical protein BCR32DRAFT_292110 [Anaeromyces robustus]|uniref:DUF4832 domain-containing protein n=1 Tax=Anaeromyces robustus TaxID=1754192 RepID=A0A1Y1XC45_9FUNG|nr:hypothetical protein BCR32DRAFT_292110 [Anaeromyces robustus]|eukprot:ORX83295.1 hypothetical protein BCR32DRAFT_292110 [Anaeromyces robustus]